MCNAHLVGAVTADLEDIDTRGVVDHVLTIACGKAVLVVARAAAQIVVAQPTRDHVGARAAQDDVRGGAGLVGNETLSQRVRVPFGAIGKPDQRHRATAQRADDDQLVAGPDEIDHEIGAVERREADHRLER